MDPDNPVVKLCVQGMQAEADHRFDEARELFERSWHSRSNDFEACIAAHYLARAQDTPDRVLFWNHLALGRAAAVATSGGGDDRVRGFHASLHLNLAKAYEDLGQIAVARRHYQLAATQLDDIDDPAFRQVVESGVTQGLRRIRLAPS